MTTLRLSGGDLGNETMRVRCNLTEASAPVEVDYGTSGGEKWEGTQWQCADTKHTTEGLTQIAKWLAGTAVSVPEELFECDVMEETDCDYEYLMIT